MILAILLISVFNLGLMVILAGGTVAYIKEYIDKAVKNINENTNNGIEQSTTAIFNMDSIKAQVERRGEFEI